MKYAGIIFDLDGVICHTDAFHYKAWKMLADRMGIYFDETINNRLRGVSRMESLNIVLERHTDELNTEEKQALALEKNEHYKALLMQMTPGDVTPDTIKTLHQLRDNGIKLAIGSSSKNAGLILSRIGLENFFDAVSDGNHITHSKPHPEVFLHAAKALGLSPSQCLVVEDARAGVEAALAGGFDCAGIGDACADERATYAITDIKELLVII